MSIKAIKTTIADTNTPCGVCLGTLSETNPTWVRHAGKDGKKHPLHQTCLKNAVKNALNPSCPSCKVKLDLSSLLSKKERLGTFIRDNKQYFGYITALALHCTMGGTRNVSVSLASVAVNSNFSSPKLAFFGSLAGAATIGIMECMFGETPLFHASVQFGVGLAAFATTKAATCISQYLLT